MKILRYKKKRSGMYELELSEGKVLLHEDLILKYALLLKKEITEEELASLKEENQKYEAYEIAVRELSRKLRTKREIQDLLVRKGFLLKEAEDAIRLLEKQGYLDETMYIESYFHDRVFLSKDGPLKIEKELLSKGISSEKVSAKLECFSEDVERERIQKIVEKLLKSNKESHFKFCQKAKYSLNQLGYHASLIEEILSKVVVDDTASYDREYQRLVRTLSKKYSGEELEYKIKQRLYQKGFRV